MGHHTAPLTHTKVTTPVGTFVGVLSTEIIQEQDLHPISKTNLSNITDVDYNIIKVIIRSTATELLRAGRPM